MNAATVFVKCVHERCQMEDISENKKKTCIFANLSIALLIVEQKFFRESVVI